MICKYKSCTSLTSVEIPSSVTTIGISAFEGCTPLQVEIPSSVTTIGNYAFYGCVSAYKIVGSPDGALPDGVSIEGQKEVIVTSNGITGTGLAECIKNASWDIDEYNAYKSASAGVITRTTKQMEIEALEHIIFDNAVPNGEYKNEDFPSLKEVTLKYDTTDSPETIDLGANFGGLPDLKVNFESVADVKALTVPQNVKEVTVDDGSLQALATLNMASGDALTSMRENGVSLPTVSTVTLTEMGDVPNEAFTTAFTPSVATVNVGAGITSLGHLCFDNAANLATLNLTDAADLKVIHGDAFQNCTALESVTLPASVERIEDRAFYGCTSLTTVTLNEGLKRIYNNAFQGTALERLHIPSTVEAIGEQLADLNFTCLFNQIPVTVAAGSSHFTVDGGMMMTQDKKELLGYYGGTTAPEVFALPDATEAIRPFVFSGSAIRHIKVGAGSRLKEVGDMAFQYMAELREIDFPATLTDLCTRGKYSLTYEEDGLCGYENVREGHQSLSVWPMAPAMAYVDMSQSTAAGLKWWYNYAGFNNRATAVTFDSDEMKDANNAYWGHYYSVDDVYGGGRMLMYNPLVYMSAATLTFMPQGYTASGLDEGVDVNIVTTDDGKTFHCDNLQLYDYATCGAYDMDNLWVGQRPYYAIPHAFTATGATLNRTFTNATGSKKFTVCLPFRVKAAKHGTFYKFNRFDNDALTVYFDEVTDEYTEANVPYLFMPAAGETVGKLVAEAEERVEQVACGIVENGQYAEYCTEDTAGNKFIGVYEYQQLDDGMMTYKDDQFGWTKNAQTAPFRCYLRPAAPVSPLQAKTFSVVYASAATGIATVEPGGGRTVSGNTEADWHTLSGQRVATPRRGIYVRNGQKVVVR